MATPTSKAADPAHVFVRQTCGVSLGSERIMLTAGEAWDATDPVVLANPDAFAPVPTRVRSFDAGSIRTSNADVLEQATARPGERRSTRRK